MLALAAIGVLVSVAVAMRDHLRDTSSNALGGVTNGTVTALEPSGQEWTMLVEFETLPGSPPSRLRSPAETVGLFAPRPRQRVGDTVLVAYDPKDSSRARVFDIRPLWNLIVRRSLLVVLLVLAAGMLARQPRAHGKP